MTDTDWLDLEPASVTTPAALPAFAGVYVVDAEGEEAVPYDTLFDATCEAPQSPESQVRGKGGLLAEAACDSARWVFTVLGRARIERELHGETPSVVKAGYRTLRALRDYSRLASTRGR